MTVEVNRNRDKAKQAPLSVLTANGNSPGIKKTGNANNPVSVFIRFAQPKLTH